MLHYDDSMPRIRGLCIVPRRSLFGKFESVEDHDSRLKAGDVAPPGAPI